MKSSIIHTLSKAFSEVVPFSGDLSVRGRPLGFCFNADPVPLKLVTHNKIVFRAGAGLCLSRLKYKRNARCVAVTDSFSLRNVSTIKARCSPVQFMAASEKSSMVAKETKNNCIIKKQSKMALYGKMALYLLFENKNIFLFLYFICLLFNVQMCQIILPGPVQPSLQLIHFIISYRFAHFFRFNL